MTTSPDYRTPLSPINFIKDNAADSDAFGPHGRIAAAIAHVLRDNPTIKAIGLLGPWGSGKSTVIKQLGLQLERTEKTERTHLFCYDAWLHQSDPPRRSFLEALVRFLDREGIPLKKEIRSRVTALSKNVEDTETTTIPILTFSGTAFIISALLVPIGLQLVNRDWYVIDTASGMDWLERIAFTTGVLFSFAPLLTGGAILALRALQSLLKRHEKSGSPKTHPLNDAEGSHESSEEDKSDHSVLAIFANKSIEKQKHRVVKTPDPTAIEFQQIFRDIFVDINKPGRKIVIVVDNLDRVYGREAMSLWGTIRSFFLGSSGGGLEEADQPVVILPVDADALERAYRLEGYEEAAMVAQSFMDKTFDITFQVNPIVLSDWKAFLNGRMKEVFGSDIDESWIFYVGRFLEKSSLNRAPITPRALNVMINKIATFWMQRPSDDINFVSLACYVVFQEDYRTDLVQQLTHPVVDIRDADPNWQQSIAAIHFGVEPSKAVQVLIDGRLHRSIMDGDAERFAELMQISGSDSVLLNQLDANSSQPSQIYLDGLATMLEGVDSSRQTWVRTAWQRIRYQYPQFKEEKLSEKTAETLRRIQSHLDTAQVYSFAQEMATRLNNMNHTGMAEATQLSALAETFDALLEICPPSAGPITLKPRIANSEYLELVQLLENADALRSTTSENEATIVSFIADSISNAEWAPTGLSKVRAMYKKSPQLKWSQVISAASDQIRRSGNPTDDTFQLSFSILKLFYEKDLGSRKALKLLSEGGFFNGLLTWLKEGPEDTLAWLTALTLSLDGPLSIESGWDAVLERFPDFPSRLEQELSTVVWERSAGNLIDASRTLPGFLPVVQPILVSWLKAEKLGLMPVSEFINDPIPFVDMFPDEYRGQFAVEMSLYEIWDGLEAHRLTASSTALLFLILETTGDSPEHRGRKQALSSLEKVVSSYTVGDWQNSIYYGHDPYEHVARLAEFIPNLSIESPLSLALSATKEQLLVNGDSNVTERWMTLAELVKPSNRAVQYKSIRDQLLSGTVGVSYNWLMFVGTSFLKTANFVEKADESVRHLVLPAISSEQGREWVLSSKDIIRGWIEIADETTREAIGDQIAALSQNSDPILSTRATELQQALILFQPPANDVNGDKGETA